jgi:hypothetical protein
MGTRTAFIRLSLETKTVGKRDINCFGILISSLSLALHGELPIELCNRLVMKGTTQLMMRSYIMACTAPMHIHHMPCTFLNYTHLPCRPPVLSYTCNVLPIVLSGKRFIHIRRSIGCLLSPFPLVLVYLNTRHIRRTSLHET